jgi:TonB-dependent starch-binding outer membrane protein SusC
MKKKLHFLLMMGSKLFLYGVFTQILFIGVLMANNTIAQKRSVKEVFINIEVHNATVLDIFKTIEKQTDFNFLFDRDYINRNIKINLEGEMSINDILLQVSKEANLSFRQINNTINVKERESRNGMAREVVEVVFQSIRVTGRVTDMESNEALPGVNVYVSGTTQGTITDIDGNYSIEVPSAESVLAFSSVGYILEEITVENQIIINLTMVPDIRALEEIVVIGYGTQKRAEVTSSVASVKEEDFNSGGVRSPLDLIQGKVAGLNIIRTQGNNPNSGAEMQLRGITSLTGTRAPLIVIDGIPGGNLDLLQQDDIESFDVLKDGSAAAIYGTRGNAGVVLITTKKGKAGDPRFAYSTYLQRETVDRKPEFLNADDFRRLISQGLISADNDYGTSTDLYDELIDKDNLSQYHNFAASGGTYSSNYRASLYYNDANGIAKQNGREQFGGRFNINQKGLNGRVELSVNVASNFNKANLLGGQVGDFEQAVQRNPTAPIYNADGTFFETQAYNNYNPMSRLANRINQRDQQTFSGDARLSVNVIDGLKVSVFGSYLRDNWNGREYRSKEDWDQRPTSSYLGTGYAAKSNHLDWTKTLESTIDYLKVVGDHTITAIAGYSYQYYSLEEFNVNNSGFTTDGFQDWNLGAGSAINNTQLPRPGMASFKEDNTLIAFFGRVNYSYKGKYFAQAVLRHEGSSRFGANNKWGNFPAFSAGWTISQEDFMSGMPVINNLKLRIGYGVTGNQGIPNYQSLVTLSTGGVYPQDGVFYQTYGGARNPNPNLKWEKKGEWNFGVDFSLLDNRLSGAIDIYNRLTNDLLYNYNAQQPPYLRSTIYTNVGSIRNSGFEVLISGIAIKKNDFRWTIDLTGSYQENKLETLSNEVFEANWIEFYGLPSPGNLGNAIRLEEGGSVGNFYGKKFAGFNDDGKWLFYKADGTTGLASEMAEDDLTVIGNGVPKINAALGNTINYKNFDLTVFFRGKFGFDILNTKEMYFGNKKWLPNNVLRSAITDHDELNDDPQYSDYYLEKGDFVKLDNVTLGYNFNVKNTVINNLRLYFTGRNLMTITGYSGIDPEVQDTGFSTGVDGRSFYPRTKSWTIGLNFGF